MRAEHYLVYSWRVPIVVSKARKEIENQSFSPPFTVDNNCSYCSAHVQKPKFVSGMINDFIYTFFGFKTESMSQILLISFVSLYMTRMIFSSQFTYSTEIFFKSSTLIYDEECHDRDIASLHRLAYNRAIFIIYRHRSRQQFVLQHSSIYRDYVGSPI